MAKQNSDGRTLYKVLVDGCAIYGELEYSLPTKDGPGDWHEVGGDLVQCRNGLHLTDNPRYRWQSNAECYLVETSGEVQHEANWGDEYVARKVRLVRRLTWEELEAFDIYPDGAGRSRGTSKRVATKGAPKVSAKMATGPSPAMALVRAVWEGHCAAVAHSWRTVNASMYEALSLAITAGLSFAESDIAEIYRGMRGPYWFGEMGEGLYAKACGAGNLQACKSFEAWAGRKPFVWEGKRLHVGAKLVWEGVLVTVTSFQDERGSLVACSYKPDPGGRLWTSRTVDRRFTVTNAQLVKAEKDRKILGAAERSVSVLQEELYKCKIEVDAAPMLAWTEEERAAVAEWVRTARHDAGKKRVKLPEPPSHLAEALVGVEARKRQKETLHWRERIQSSEREIARERETIAYAKAKLAELSEGVVAPSLDQGCARG